MNQSYCIVRLTGHDIDGSSVSCLGIHLKKVLQVLSIQTSNCVWFIADIDFFQNTTTGLMKKSHRPQLFGTTQQLINLSETVDQFISGIFFAVPEYKIPIKWESSFFTDDTYLGNMDDYALVIKAFDTTFLEVYAATQNRISEVAHIFHSTITCY